MIAVQLGFVGLAVLLVAGRVALSWSDGIGALLWAVVPIVGVLACNLWAVVIWRRFRAADALAEVSAWGIRVNDMGDRGWVAIPWDAIASVRKDLWGRIVVKPAEGVGPSTPGTEWPASRSTARRARRKGLLIFVQASDAAHNQILAAVHHFSGGRL